MPEILKQDEEAIVIKFTPSEAWLIQRMMFGVELIRRLVEDPNGTESNKITEIFRKYANEFYKT